MTILDRTYAVWENFPALARSRHELCYNNSQRYIERYIEAFSDDKQEIKDFNATTTISAFTHGPEAIRFSGIAITIIF